MVDGLISAKDIVDKYGITYQTINHYTNFGLLAVVLKKRNVRFYKEEEVKTRLEKIQQYAGEGYSLNLIRKMLTEQNELL